MKTLRTIIFSLPVLLLSACYCWNSDDRYVDFDDDTELLIYEVGDTLIYTSDLGNVDTFYVAEIRDGWEDGLSNEDFCDTYTYRKYRMYCFDRYTSIDKSKNYIYYPSSLPSLTWNDIVFQLSLVSSNLTEKYQLGDSIYQNVFYDHYSHASYGNMWCYFSKSYGILQYNFDQTETWTLTKTILKKQRK